MAYSGVNIIQRLLHHPGEKKISRNTSNRRQIPTLNNGYRISKMYSSLFIYSSLLLS